MILEVKGLKKGFEGNEILKGIDLTVEKGDVVAILGPSGSGKTTMLRCLNFLETADEGELSFDGKTYSLHGISKKEIAEVRISIPNQWDFTHRLLAISVRGIR